MNKKDLKILWGKAAGRCSICKLELVNFQNNITIGEMAHIIAKSPNGPRGIENSIDSYDNLILLCPNHHREIDKNPLQWDIDRLRKVKQEHELWVTESLRSGKIAPLSVEFYNRLENIFLKNGALERLLWADVGNSRFLRSLKDDENYIWLKLHDDFNFRKNYLNILDIYYQENYLEEPPFHFDFLNSIIAFPDGLELLNEKFLLPTFDKFNEPLLLQNFELIEKNGKTYFQTDDIKTLDFLPTESGYINDIDPKTHIPTKVSKNPSEEFHGAFYWVKPSGLRTIFMSVGVFDPIECFFAMAIWWSLDDKKPFFGYRPIQEMTPEIQREHEANKIKKYISIFKKYSSKKWNQKESKFE